MVAKTGMHVNIKVWKLPGLRIIVVCIVDRDDGRPCCRG